VRVGGIEPGGQPPAQSNGGHAAGNRGAQNPAYRRVSKELIEKIIETKPNDSNLKAIISEISKKQKESKYV